MSSLISLILYFIFACIVGASSGLFLDYDIKISEKTLSSLNSILLDNYFNLLVLTSFLFN